MFLDGNSARLLCNANIGNQSSKVIKIGEERYLNRVEAIEYLLHGYGVRWCNTKWSVEWVVFSFEGADGQRHRRKIGAYQIRKSTIARVRKSEIDAWFVPSEGGQEGDPDGEG